MLITGQPRGPPKFVFFQKPCIFCLFRAVSKFRRLKPYFKKRYFQKFPKKRQNVKLILTYRTFFQNPKMPEGQKIGQNLIFAKKISQIHAVLPVLRPFKLTCLYLSIYLAR